MIHIKRIHKLYSKVIQKNFKKNHLSLKFKISGTKSKHLNYYKKIMSLHSSIVSKTLILNQQLEFVLRTKC